MADPRDNDKDQRIRQRAYEIWEREGYEQGHELRHWDRAAREIEEERSSLLQSSVDVSNPDGRTDGSGLESGPGGDLQMPRTAARPRRAATPKRAG